MKLTYGKTWETSDHVKSLMASITNYFEMSGKESPHFQKQFGNAKSIFGMFIKNNGLTNKQIDSLVRIKIALTPRPV